MITRPKLLVNLEKINTAASASMGASAATDAGATSSVGGPSAEVGVDPVSPPPVGTTDGLEGDATSSDLPHPPSRPQSRSNHRSTLPPPPPRVGVSAVDGSTAGIGNISQSGVMPPTTPGSVDTNSMGGLSMSLPGSPSETQGQGLGQGLGQGFEGDSSHVGSAGGGLGEDVTSVMVSVGREESHGPGLRPGLEGGDDSRDEARSISNSTISSHGITPALPVPSYGGSLTRTSRNVYDGSISSATLPSVRPSPCHHILSIHHINTSHLINAFSQPIFSTQSIHNPSPFEFIHSSTVG